MNEQAPKSLAVSASADCETALIVARPLRHCFKPTTDSVGDLRSRIAQSEPASQPGQLADSRRPASMDARSGKPSQASSTLPDMTPQNPTSIEVRQAAGPPIAVDGLLDLANRFAAAAGRAVAQHELGASSAGHDGNAADVNAPSFRRHSPRARGPKPSTSERIPVAV
jgi:hypothetical protein